IGDFATGRSTRFAGFYLSARSTEFLSRSFENASEAKRLSIPLRIRGRAGDCQNIVPVDYVASAIAGAINLPEARGRIYHLAHAQSAAWGRTLRRVEPVSANSSCRPYFEAFLPGSIAGSKVAKQTAVSAVVRFIIEDDPCGEWVCRFERGRLAELHRGANGL